MMPESIVLTQQEHQTIVGLTERLATILRRLERQVRKDPAALQQLGIPPEVGQLIQQEVDSPLQLARYDFFPTPSGGWAVSEFNEDVPGGFNEIIAAPQLLPPFHPGLEFVDRFSQALLSAVQSEGPVALMYATGYSEDLQHMLALQALLKERGQESVLCSPRHLHRTWRGLTIAGQSIASAIRFYPGEWFPLLENRRDWGYSVQRLPMLNPLCRLISQSKSIFAIWEEPGLVGKDDLEFLHSVAPRTLQMNAVTRDPNYGQQVRQFPRQWVLKQNFGRMGENVVMGRLATEDDWRSTLAIADKHADDFIAQECFHVAPLMFSDGPLYPAIGAFVINGQFAGYYSRVAKEPFLTHEATYVPTVIDVQ